MSSIFSINKFSFVINLSLFLNKKLEMYLTSSTLSKNFGSEKYLRVFLFTEIDSEINLWKLLAFFESSLSLEIFKISFDVVEV